MPEVKIIEPPRFKAFDACLASVIELISLSSMKRRDGVDVDVADRIVRRRRAGRRDEVVDGAGLLEGAGNICFLRHVGGDDVQLRVLAERLLSRLELFRRAAGDEYLGASVECCFRNAEADAPAAAKNNESSCRRATS